MTRTNKILWGLGVSVMLSVPVGCMDNSDVRYSQFADLPSDGWNVLDGREFRPFDKDSLPSGEYRIVLALRHSDRIRYTRLWLELEQADARGVTDTDTVAVEIAGPDGRLSGEGSFGLYEVADTLPVPVKVTPGWQVSVRHIMKEEEVAGLNNIGVILLRE